MPRIRYTKEVRQHAVALALDSNTSVAQVARDVGCSVNSLHLWIKQLRQQDAPSTIPQDKATFVPVNIIDDRRHPVEIVTPHGVIIRLTDASPQYIAELLNAFASC